MSSRKIHEEYLTELKEKGIDIEVIEEYKDNKTPIKHMCPKCGRKDWMVKPNKILTGNAKACSDCKSHNTEWYRNRLLEVSIRIKVLGEYINIATPIEHECPVCKEQGWMVSPNSILNYKSTMCKSCSTAKRTMQDYVEQANALGVKVIGKYKGIKVPIAHECTMCKRQDWMGIPYEILRNGCRMCKQCSDALKESQMATTLKQVIKHEYPDTIWEYDAGFKGIGGGKGCYDIYIPNLNTLIECQSEYHDTPKRRDNDRLKEQYAEENNYRFCSLDNREYTPLRALQKFFPYMTSIPEYVDIGMDTTTTFPFEEAQELLNSRKNYTEIASIINKSDSIIHYYINKGRLTKPADYDEQIVIQLDSSGKLININNMHNIGRKDEGYSIKCSILQACRSLNHSYKGYLWYYKGDYIKQYGEIDTCNKLILTDASKMLGHKKIKSKSIQKWV